MKPLEILEYPSFLEYKPEPLGGIIAGYFGVFHKNTREPYQLIDTFGKLSNVELHIFTSLACFYDIVGKDYMLPKNIKVYEEVPFDDFEKIVFHYSCLINIENKNTQLKPSKLQTLLSTGLPIISFGV